MAATGFVSTSGDTRKLNVAGGTMTGDLVLTDSTPDTALSATSKAFVEAAVAAATGGGPVNDPAKLDVAGGTMLGDLVLSDSTPNTGLSATSRDFVTAAVAAAVPPSDPTKLNVAGGTMTGDLVLSDSTPDTVLSAASRGFVEAAVAAVPTSDPTKLNVAGGTMTGDLVLSDSTPDTNLSATSKAYVQTLVDALSTLIAGKLSLAGGTMVGDLVLSDSTPDTDLSAVPKGYVTSAVDALTTLISAKLDVAGGTMTGDLALSDSTPNTGLSATSRDYVATAVASAVSDLTTLIAAKLSRAGGTMTGDLVLSDSTPDTALSATSRDYVTNAVASAVTTLTTLIGTKLNVAGGTMTGDLVLSDSTPDTALSATSRDYVTNAVAAAVTDLTNLVDDEVALLIPLTQRGTPNGVATLDADQKILASQMPAISVTDYLGPTANEAAMLALVPGQLGDWTIRTDLSTTWVISGADPTLLASWTELGYPNAVTSVAGHVGIVLLAGEDITSGTLAYARLPVGNTLNTVAAGDDARIIGAAQKDQNLADLPNASTARTNLGLGGAATLNVGIIPGTVAAADDSRIVDAVQDGEKGAANGVATLDSGALLPHAQLPAIAGEDITSGTVAYARLPVGTAANTVAAGDVTTTALAGKVAKGDLVFDIRDYGATTGSASNNTAIQAAIDAAAAANGRVFIPSGTWKVTPALVGAGLLLKAGLRGIYGNGTSSVLKVIDSVPTGEYYAIMSNYNGTTSADVGGLTLSDFEIDQNNTNNQWATAATQYTIKPRFCLYITLATSKVTIRRMGFLDVDGTNCISISGTIRDHTIEGCRFFFGTSSIDHDTSIIYTNPAGQRSASSVIVNNIFRSPGPGSFAARCAIETHGGAQHVTGNVIDGFAKGGNICGVSVFGYEGIVVSGNVVTNAKWGFMLWSLQYSTNLTRGLKNVIIRDNVIRLNGPGWQPVYSGSGYANGIVRNSTDLSLGGLPFEDILIDSNIITFDNTGYTGVAGDTIGNGIEWREPALSMTDKRIVIRNNRIDSPLASGIRWSALGEAIEIVNNFVRNPGQASVAAGGAMNNGSADGIMVNGAVTNSHVSDNQIIDDQGTPTTNFGIYLLPTAAGSANNRATGNKVPVAYGKKIETVTSSFAGGWFITMVHETYMAVTGNAVVGSTITDRTTGIVRTQTTAPVGTTWVAADAATRRAGAGSPEGTVTAPVGSLYQRTDGGTGTSLYIKETGTGTTGWSPVATAAGTWVAKGELVYNVADYGAFGDGTTNDTAAVQAALNAAPNGSTIVLAPGKNYSVGALAITNKVNYTFDGQGATLTYRATGARIGLTLVGTCTNVTIQNLNIVGNGVLADAHAGIYCNSGQTLSTIRVLRNRISNVTLGISFNADGSGSLSDIVVEGNHVETVVGTTSGNGYGLHHSSSDTTSHQLVKFVNNTVIGAQRHSIYQAKGLGIVISGNTIRDHRLGVADGSLLSAIMVARSGDVTITGNNLSDGYDSAMTIGGLPQATLSRNYTVSGNSFATAKDSIPFLIIGQQDPATEGFPDGVVVTGNTFYSNTTAAAVSLYSGKRVRIANNMIQNVVTFGTATAIRIGSLDETAGTATYTDDLVVESNTIYMETGGTKLPLNLSGVETTGINMRFANNRITTPGNVFYAPVTLTNPNIVVYGQKASGLAGSWKNSIPGEVAHAAPVFNVADYGAVGNGSTDDRVAINNAVAAAAAVGGTVILRGNHAINGSVTLLSGVTIDGTQGAITQTANLTAALSGSNVTDLTIRNLKITGVGSDYVNTSSVYAAAGIAFGGTSTRLTVDNCTLNNSAGAGVYLGANVHVVRITDCTITGPGAPPIVGTTSNFSGGVVAASPNNDIEIGGCRISQYAQGVVTGECSRVRIHDNYIFSIVGQHGLYLEPAAQVAITGNVINSTVLQGIKLQIGSTSWPDITDCTITGNTITNAGSHAILLTNPVGGAPRLRRIIVTDNTLSTTGVGGDGINCISVVGAIITDNTILNARSGISLDSSSSVLVATNRIETCSWQGIVLTNTSDSQVLSNRIIDPASANVSTSQFGIQATGASTANLLIDGNIVSDSLTNMQYGLYVVTTADQDTIAIRNNDVSGASDFGARLDPAQGIKEWSNNVLVGTIGDVTGYPTALVVKGQSREFIATAAPTTGTYKRGDRVWNTTPSSGGPVGWVCVTAGTPGTWVELAGSGGSAQTLVINVKDAPYNAVGNGSANDTAAITAALAAAALVRAGGDGIQQGGVVYFPPGTYMTDGNHNIPSYVHIAGCEPAGRYWVYNGTDVPTTSCAIKLRTGTTAPALFSISASSTAWSIRNISLLGSQTGTGIDGIAFATPAQEHNSIVENVAIIGFTGDGIRGRLFGTRWRNLFIGSNRGYGLNCDGTFQWTDSFFSNCIVSGNILGGVNFASTAHCGEISFTDCRFERSGWNPATPSTPTATNSPGIRIAGTLIGAEFTSCSTDANSGNGVDIVRADTSVNMHHIQFTGCRMNRDGFGTMSGGVAPDRAAVRISGASGARIGYISFTGCMTTEGKADDGGGLPSYTHAKYGLWWDNVDYCTWHGGAISDGHTGGRMNFTSVWRPSIDVAAPAGTATWPVWTTSTRPTTGNVISGHGYNETTSQLEVWNGAGWVNVDSAGGGGITLAQLNSKTVVTVARTAGADYFADGTADNVEIQAAIDAVIAAGGGTVLVKAGTYNLSAGLNVVGAVNGFVFAGEGQGATKFVCSMTGDDPALQIQNNPVGSDLNLTVSTVVGDRTITMSSGNAATLAVNDWILIKSNKLADDESAGKFVGQLSQVTGIAGGVVTLNDVIFDTYTTADGARVVKLVVPQNITVRDFSVSSVAATSDLSTGFLDFRFVSNLTVRNIEMHHAWHSLQLRSCINTLIEGCYIHDIDEPGPRPLPPDPDDWTNLRYGIWVANASQNIVISNCRFRQTRHAITFGTNSGTNGNGIQRNVVVANCVSQEADTAHFDCHQPVDGITFIGCSAIGGMVYQAVPGEAVVGFQSRGRNVSFIGCLALAIPGRGYMAQGAQADNTRFIGCSAVDIQERLGGGEGVGFYVDSGGSNRHIINGCIVLGSDSAGLSATGSAHDCVVTNNVFENTGRSVTTAAVKFTNALRGVFANNRVIGTSSGAPFQLSGTSSNWQIHGNSFTNTGGTNTPVLVGVNSVHDNIGCNPDWLIARGNLTGAATFSLALGTTHTCTMTGNLTATIPGGVAAGDRLRLVLKQDATGGRTFTKPANALVAGGVFIPTATANAVSALELEWDGTNWLEAGRSMNLS